MHGNPWEDDYCRRGTLWGGSAPSLPLLPHASRILELGSGNGKTVSSLVQAGHSVTAIDISPRAASLCRLSSPDPVRTEILVADGRKTPFRDGAFDVAIASHVAGHLPRAGRSLLAGEIFRLLVPGGMVYFRDFSTGDFRYGRGGETETGTFIRKTGIATHYFTEGELLDLFAGFSVQSLSQHRWEMRVRGRVYPRAEIVAGFIRPDGLYQGHKPFESGRVI